MKKNERVKIYSDAEVTAIIRRDLPHWVYENSCIVRIFRTNSWKATLMAINTVGHLAEAAWHHPDISASYATLEVRLHTHDAQGITDKDFALARKIESVIGWQPGKEEGALTGIPEDDARNAYLIYD